MAIRRKRSKFLELITLIFLCVLFCTNDCAEGDLAIYKAAYLKLHVNSGMEFGYVAIANVFSRLGISFNVFLLFIFLVCVVLIHKGVKKIIKNYHVLFAVTMPYIFPWLSFTLRFFIGMSIVIYALPKLFLKRKILLFMILVIIAAMFHKSMLLFELLIFVNLKRDGKHGFKFKGRKIACILLGISVAVSVIIFLNGNMLPFADLIEKLVSRVLSKMAGKFAYYLKTRTHYGFIIIFAIYFVGLAIVLSCRNRINKSLNVYSNADKKYIELVSQAYMIFGIALPMVMINLSFFRYVVVMYLLLIVALSIELKGKPKPKVKQHKKVNSHMTMALVFSTAVWCIPAVMSLFGATIGGMIGHSFWGI